MLYRAPHSTPNMTSHTKHTSLWLRFILVCIQSHTWVNSTSQEDMHTYIFAQSFYQNPSQTVSVLVCVFVCTVCMCLSTSVHEPVFSPWDLLSLSCMEKWKHLCLWGEGSPNTLLSVGGKMLPVCQLYNVISSFSSSPVKTFSALLWLLQLVIN